jgi:hypothetical protein
MKNVASKTRKSDNPYATWTDPKTGWKYRLLKSWQADNSKEYSRWFVLVEGWGTDMGDEYCSNMRPGLNRAMSSGNENFDFDRTVWSTGGEFAAWAWGER